MARLDVHKDRSGAVPYLVDVQADLLADLRTRMVVPLLPENALPRRVARLHPAFEIEGRPLVMATNLMAGVDRRQLGEVVESLADEHPTITAAIDFLLQGF